MMGLLVSISREELLVPIRRSKVPIVSLEASFVPWLLNDRAS